MSELSEKRKKDLIDFALVTLEIMESEFEWTPDVLDRLASEAFNRRLATTNTDGMFTRIDIYTKCPDKQKKKGR